MATSSDENEKAAPTRLSYREQEVDETLDNHEIRIRRLEKVALVVVGYGLAEGSNIISHIVQLV